MESKTKIQYISSKGQITLPASWRRDLQTDAIIVRQKGNGLLEIAPARIHEDEKGWVSVFDAKRDNNGKPLSAKEVLSALHPSKK
ncbi:MAG: AbrB/MazE/SpoVT family DNA-binding domain-containing protein [bacterium]|nr:AbrB/MazE/SpoVT family DNA-binding domain-containing protein [bacterium]